MYEHTPSSAQWHNPDPKTQVVGLAEENCLQNTHKHTHTLSYTTLTWYTPSSAQWLNPDPKTQVVGLAEKYCL